MYDTALLNQEIGGRRLSNERLANLAGVDPSTVSRIRNGKANVTLPTLKKVADALGLDLVVKLEKRPV